MKQAGRIWNKTMNAGLIKIGFTRFQADPCVYRRKTPEGTIIAAVHVDDFAYTSTWDAQIAKLALASILIDTVDLKADSKITEDDRKAVRFLEAKINISRKLGKDYDRDRFYAEINDAKSHLDDLSLEEEMAKLLGRG